ncbi:MAG: hypothetical protein NXI32_24015, partial [bacterium]|nr:hypothetical protein [bacterium]
NLAYNVLILVVCFGLSVLFVSYKKSGRCYLNGKPTASRLTPPDQHPDGWKVLFAAIWLER